MSETLSSPENERVILTPSRLNRAVRELLEKTFPLVWVEGEISNLTRHSSGHTYFTLKDAEAQVRCALFRNRAAYLRFRPSDGMRVLVRARVGLYEGRGEFQLIAELMEDAGEGALRREFERLKTQLATEGLFDAARKRGLPRLPKRIAVVTSPNGAALHDVLSVVARRYALAQIEILPVPVQGAPAAPAIAAMLAAASKAGRYDVLLLTRGGGSLEDLWAFNDERVARAIAAASMPVVSAIGHETDFSIADFVADLRAATPSAAAELLVPDSAALTRALGELRHRGARALERLLLTRAQRLDTLYARVAAHSPAQRLALGRHKLQAMAIRLEHWRKRITEQRHARLTLNGKWLDAQRLRQELQQRRLRIRALADQLRTRGIHSLESQALRLSELGRALNLASPLATLQRGYAILRDARSGSIIRSVVSVQAGQTVSARLADGELSLRVES